MKPNKRLTLKKHASHGLTAEQKEARFADIAKAIGKRVHERKAAIGHQRHAANGVSPERIARLRERAARVHGSR